jgi:diguanylate cyclase (GGDEF)-like protein
LENRTRRRNTEREAHLGSSGSPRVGAGRSALGSVEPPVGKEHVTTNVVRCPTCGEAAEVPSCPACGAELLTDAVVDQAEHDQVQARFESDQTASDQDQTWSDHDQSASESDQRTADEDQHAADEDLAAGGDRTVHDRSAEARERSSRDRATVSAVRDETAGARLRTAEERDRAASLRDRGAEGRDALARLHDLEDDENASREEILFRARRDRARAAADRAKAADDRTRAAADREDAARARAEAFRHRAESAEALKSATTDELTGVWTRRFGLDEAARELERAHRTGASLMLAFVDVDGLKRLNDSRGHVAGDALLRLLGAIVRSNLRPYDVILRYGGDELVCAMPNLSAAEARVRFETIAAALSTAEAAHSVSFGLAESEPDDDLEELIARADANLLGARRSR